MGCWNFSADLLLLNWLSVLNIEFRFLQVDFIRQLALEMNNRLETVGDGTQLPLPPRDKNATEEEVESADFESRCGELQQMNDELRKQLNSSQNQVLHLS